MWQFLAKLGRTKFGQNAMPTLCVGSATVYSSVHLVLHNQIRDFFAAQAPSGRREKISEHLQQLITETHTCTREHGLGQKSGKLGFGAANNAIKWFASCTIEPIQFGSLLSSNGLIIGLPNYFNYQKTDDIPDSAFDIQKISFLRSPQDSKKEAENEITESMESVQSMSGGAGGQAPVKSVLVRKIERNSSEGLEYMDSLVLSDKAKKFSIARELFLGGTLRTLFEMSLYFMSFTLAIASGRAAVRIWKLKERHITQRLPFYLVAGMLGTVNYQLLSRAIDQMYAEQADKKAKEMGEEYVEGAEEYVKKRAIRNKILGINK